MSRTLSLYTICSWNILLVPSEPEKLSQSQKIFVIWNNPLFWLKSRWHQPRKISWVFLSPKLIKLGRLKSRWHQPWKIREFFPLLYWSSCNFWVNAQCTLLLFMNYSISGSRWKQTLTGSDMYHVPLGEQFSSFHAPSQIHLCPYRK